MAERRRIIPSSVGPLFPSEKEKESVPTMRFQLTLKEPNDTTCSVFSYCQLVKNAVREKNSNGDVNQSYNETEEDDIGGLESIAKKFEEKYAPKKGKKRKNVFIDELIDVGMGYDETDPFVDNSECYDELVPDVLTTQHGGFYINQGQLQFRERSDSDNSDFQDAVRRKMKSEKKKHRRTSDGDRKEGKRKRNASSSSDKAAKKMRKQLQRQLGKPGRKKNISSRIPTIAELLKLREGSGKKVVDTAATSETPTSTKTATPATTTPMSSPPTSSPPTATTHAATTVAAQTATTLSATIDPSGLLGVSDSHHPMHAGSGDDDADLNMSIGDIDPSLDLGLIMSDLKMDSDMAAAMEEALRASLEDGDVASPCGGGGGADDGEGAGGEGPSALPSGLSVELGSDVDEIIEAARKSVEGKCKFFTAAVNNLLLRIENQSRELTCGTRSQLYSHLAAKLPCSKETLLKRAKKLRLSAHDSCLKEPVNQLKEAILHAMPAQLERYQKECQLSELEKYNANANKGQFGDDDSKTKSTRGLTPSKKFQWTDRIRQLLCAIVEVKIQTYKMSKIRTQSAEDYLKMFLEDELKPLWPAGWMQTRTLYKESRSVHNSLTALPSTKQRKVLPLVKNLPSTLTSPQEPQESNLRETSHKQDKLSACLISSENSQDSVVRTILDYASDSTPVTPSDLNKSGEKTRSIERDPVVANRSKTHLVDVPAPKLKDTRNFVDMLIAEQLAQHDKQDAQLSKTISDNDAKAQSKRGMVAGPSKRRSLEDDVAAAQLLQLDILRKAAMVSYGKDGCSTEASSEEFSPYSAEMRALAQVVAAGSGGGDSAAKRTRVPLGVQQPKSAGKVPTAVAKSSYQLEFEKMTYKINAQNEPIPEVIKLTTSKAAVSQKYLQALTQQHPDSANKTMQSKSAFDKLCLAGQGAAAEPYVKRVHRPDILVVGHHQPTSEQMSHNLLSPTGIPAPAAPAAPTTTTTPQQYPVSVGSTNRDPINAAHRLLQHSTPSPGVISASHAASLPAYPRKDSTFMTVTHQADNIAAAKKHLQSIATPPTSSLSPPKGSSPHSVRTSPYSTSPIQVISSPPGPPSHRTPPHGQKSGFLQYQRVTPTSPGHAASSYSTGFPSVSGYQQLGLADVVTRKQSSTSPNFASPTYPMGSSGHVSPGHQGSASSTSHGDAIITGPAPGTFYHTQSPGNILGSMQSSPSGPSPNTSTNSQRLLNHQQITLDAMLYASQQAFPETHRKQKQHGLP